MTFSNISRFASLAGILLCSFANAQTRVCLGGDLDHLSQAQRASCSAKVQAVKSVAAALQAPEGWHFVLVCGDQGWKDYAAYVGGENSRVLEASANTDLDQHETFLREDRLDLSNMPAFRRAMAREVAGIVLHSNDDAAIDSQMKLRAAHHPEQSGF